MAQRVLETLSEARRAAVTTSVYERGLKWAIGMKTAAETGTRKIGIEMRREKIDVTVNAATEFNRLVHERFYNWCIQNGVLVDHSIAARIRKIISLHVRGLNTDVEVEKRYIPAPYDRFLDEMLKSNEVIELYRKILKGKKL